MSKSAFANNEPRRHVSIGQSETTTAAAAAAVDGFVSIVAERDTESKVGSAQITCHYGEKQKNGLNREQERSFIDATVVSRVTSDG